MIENLSVGEHCGSSYHQIIRWNMVACKEFFNPIKNLNYSKGDYDSMRLEAGLIHWNEIITGNDVETDWNRLKLFFEEMQSQFIPFRNSQINKDKWITRAVIKSRRAKNKAWIRFKQFENDLIAFEKYKEKQKISRHLIRVAKQNFEQKLSKM